MTPRPAPAWYRNPWRVAALLVLAGGAAGVLWIDPALLDDPRVKYLIAGLFALLWMVPYLQAGFRQRAAEKQARSAAVIVTADSDLQAGRRWLDTFLGLVAGVLGGALALSFPGTTAALSSGPVVVGRTFDLIGPYGLVALIALTIVLRFGVVWLLGSALKAIRASRFIGGLVIGLYLWVPFHGALGQFFGRIGFDLPGLAVSQNGVEQ